MELIEVHNLNVADDENNIALRSTNTQETLLDQIDGDGQSYKLARGCREGFCGACRCKLLKGSVKYTEAPIGFVNDGEILPCIVIPQTDEVIVSQKLNTSN